MQTNKFNCKVIGPCSNESAVVRPSYTTNPFAVKVAIFFVKYKRWESFYVWWSFKNFCFDSASNKEKLWVGTKAHSCDFISEVEMSHNYFSLHVYDQTEAFFVDWDECFTVRRETKQCDIASVLKGQSLGYVSCQIEQVNFIANWREKDLICWLDICFWLLFCEQKITSGICNTTKIRKLS